MADASRMVVLRIDDVGGWEPSLERVLSALLPAGIPLSLQVVPGWVDRLTVERIRCLHETHAGQLELGQHGWMHVSHAPCSERRYEFGPARSRAEQRRDIRMGRERLRELFALPWAGVFTPPHDRLNQDTLDVLAEDGYAIVSGGPLTFAGLAVAESLRAFPCSVDASSRVHGRRVLRDPRSLVSDVLEQPERVIGVVLHPAEITHEDGLAELVRCLQGLRGWGVTFELMSRALLRATR